MQAGGDVVGVSLEVGGQGEEGFPDVVELRDAVGLERREGTTNNAG